MIRFASRGVRCATLTGTALSLAGCGGPSGSELVEWQLVWQDEFEGPAGQPPNPAKWGYDIGTDWGNAQLEYDTDRPENVSLDGNGHLAITAREESYGSTEACTAPFTPANKP